MSMLTAARYQQPVPSVRSVPAARRLAFQEFQHLPNRCEKCAKACKKASSRFVCSCGATCCKACYGLKGSDAPEVTGYQCDACREELKGAVVVHPREGYAFCFACRVPLQQLEIQAYCPDCNCKFCQRCAALALSERQRPAPKRLPDGSTVVGDSLTVTQKCPTCAGSEKYEQGREAVCVLLMDKALGHRVRDFGVVN